MMKGKGQRQNICNDERRRPEAKHYLQVALVLAVSFSPYKMYFLSKISSGKQDNIQRRTAKFISHLEISLDQLRHGPISLNFEF